MRAVHFGAGNIGRGFVGLLLHNAGYELVFADVAAPLIDALDSTPSYRVHEVGEESATHTVDGYTALNSGTAEAAVVEQIAGADVVTTAVGPSILKFVAPVIAAGIAARSADAPRVAVMACENAINATDILAERVREHYTGDDLAARAVFANTAVDRIVPAQDPDAGLDVTVETFFEWAIDRTPFGGEEPGIPGVTWVDDLAPYIERKLFTVNTGHATSAYFGYAAGVHTISDALADPAIRDSVDAVLQETKALLVAKHGFSDDQQQAYVEKILSRFANPHLPDTVERVGRAPLRKLSRHERFVGPAAEAAERGLPTAALEAAMAAALRFDVPEDAEAVELQRLLASTRTEDVVEQVTGLTPEDALYERVAALVRDRQAR